MAKEELIQFEGLVTEILPMPATACSSMPDTRSSPTPPASEEEPDQTLAGDRVTIEMSPYDLEKGRLIFVTRTSGRAAEARVVHRRRPIPAQVTPPQLPEIALARSPRCAVTARCHETLHQKMRTSGLFLGAASHNMYYRFSADDISYPPVQPFRR